LWPHDLAPRQEDAQLIDAPLCEIVIGVRLDREGELRRVLDRLRGRVDEELMTVPHPPSVWGPTRLFGGPDPRLPGRYPSDFERDAPCTEFQRVSRCLRRRRVRRGGTAAACDERKTAEPRMAK
jgi:hypothetical protein